MRVLVLTLFILISLLVHPQEPQADSTRLLSEVVVSARRLDRFSAGLQINSISNDSYRSFPGLLLSGLLGTQSTHFVKSYGAGGLATISMRGTAAQHTAVYWNGFNINPPNISMADISMLPLFLFKRIDLVSGGSSALFGNGSIGGSIHLNSQNGFKENNLRIALSLGQYKDRLIALSTDYKIWKLYLSTSAWYNSARNDFVFVNTAKFGSPKEKLSNADAEQLGIMQEFHLPVSQRQNLKAGFWFQEREAGIPPSMTMLQSHAHQYDRMMRGYAQWNLETGRLSYSLKSGFNNDFLRYTDSLIGLDSKIDVSVWSSEAELVIELSKLTKINTGATFQLHDGKLDAYQGRVRPGELSIFLLARHEFPALQWVLTAGARQEYHSNFSGIPPALSLGWKGKINEALSGRLNISSNYRTPTLNDRYWKPGGNPDLLAESSINIETGLDIELKNEKLSSVFSTTFYSGRIKNWITWLPTALNYWKPENINEVVTYGVENTLTTNYNTLKASHYVALSYAATRSLYGDGSKDNQQRRPQLIYTPVHMASLEYSAIAGKWSARYLHKITGPRYTDRANTNRLPAYHTADLSLARVVRLSKTQFTINASVKNITNHAYQVIEYRPMPGRTFNVSLILDLKFKEKLTTKFNQP